MEKGLRIFPVFELVKGFVRRAGKPGSTEGKDAWRYSRA
jgi:hypothetical protein